MATIGSYLVNFDEKYLTDHPSQKANLLRFYCNIWKFDPNFAEYRRCPICKKYFSQNEVEVVGMKYCLGTNKKSHPLTILEEAWTPEIAENDLRPVLSLGKDFFGAIAITPDNDQIVGFVWGYVIDFSIISKKWPDDIVSKIKQEMPCTRVAYFQEIASDPNFRGHGVGSALCATLTSWMKQNYSTLPSMLHTHETSSAIRIFQKAGYRLFARTDQINSGRILMATKRCSLLTPEDL